MSLLGPARVLRIHAGRGETQYGCGIVSNNVKPCGGDQVVVRVRNSRSESVTPTGNDQVAGRVVDELKRMIISGDLLPGQQIRQEIMAEQLGVSRLPIREGLRQLTADGLVQHVHNVGYAVARLEQKQFDQVYLMRAALETEVLLRLPELDSSAIDVIETLNTAVADAAEQADYLEMRLRNQDFHFAIFEHSNLELVVAELRRLWTLAMPYHAVYLYDPEGRARIIREHGEMIDALRHHDNKRLVQLMDQHRTGGQSNANLMLRSGQVHR